MDFNASFSDPSSPNAGEEISEIFADKVLFIQQLTDATPIKPELVTLHSLQNVIDHFKPSCTVSFKTLDEKDVHEQLHFRTIADFSPAAIKINCSYLNKMELLRTKHTEVLET